MIRAGALSDFQPSELAVAVFFAFAVMVGSGFALSASALVHCSKMVMVPPLPGLPPDLLLLTVGMGKKSDRGDATQSRVTEGTSGGGGSREREERKRVSGVRLQCPFSDWRRCLLQCLEPSLAAVESFFLCQL